MNEFEVVDEDEDVGGGCCDCGCCSCFTKNIESLRLLFIIRDVRWCDGFGLGGWEDDES